MPQVNRANAAVNLNLPGAWVGGVAPTSSDIAAWGTPNITTGPLQALGGAVSWQGILLQSAQTTAISIGTTSAAMTLGVSGIDLSTSGANLTIASPVVVVLGASQTWTVASGRTLTSSAAANAISGNAQNLILNGLGTKSLPGAATNWTNSTVTVAAGLAIADANNSLGAASNVVVVQSGAALRVSAAAPAQTSWSISGSGLSGSSYGALWTNSSFGSSTRVITAKAQDTVLSIRAGVSFTGTVALDTGIDTITLNGETSSAPIGDNTFYRMTSQSPYSGTVTLSSLALNGTTDVGTKYSIGSAANASDLITSGGGGLGVNTNNVVIQTTGGIYTNAANSVFYRNYTFTPRGARKLYNQFKLDASSTTELRGTLTLSGDNTNYVQFGGTNTSTSIIKLNGTITGGANIDVGSNGTNGSVDGVLEIGSSLDSSGWSGTAALSVNYIRYGASLANANPISFVLASPSTVDAVVSGVTARHSSYSGTSIRFLGTNSLTMTGPVSGSADWTGAPGTWLVDASTLTLGFNFVTSGVLTKTGAGTLALAGSNSGLTGINWNVGNLTLNNNNAAGPTGSTFTAASTGTLDSTTGATLSQTGANALNANFTWGGSGDLTFGAGALSWNAARTINFINGKTGILRFSGNIGALGATLTLSVGGSPAGGSRSTLWIAGTNGMLATTSSVTAGYLRVSNSAGLGNATTTMWTVSSGAALELDGGISPTGARSVTITGPGPNTDGALRSRSGTNVWSGAIIPPVQSLASPTRIQVDAGTFTLSTTGSPSYTTIDPTTTGTPLQFTALGAAAVLNQPRSLTNKVSDVTINNGGAGTVVLSVANQHTGGTTVEGGTCKVTDVNATSTGIVQVNATATLESTVQSQFTTLRLGTTGSGARAILKFAA